MLKVYHTVVALMPVMSSTTDCIGTSPFRGTSFGLASSHVALLAWICEIVHD